MLAIEFPGCRQLIEALDAAVCHDCPTSITDSICEALCRLIHDPSVCLPDCVLQPCRDHYGRRELYRCEKHGYSVIAMTWGPGQGTPIHDHAGMWCVEGVWHGSLDVTSYELMEQQDERYRFESRGTINAGTGSAGSLIPPHEYHTIHNSSPTITAVSLHIYRNTMTCCSVFEPVDDSWYERRERTLCLDQTH